MASTAPSPFVLPPEKKKITAQVLAEEKFEKMIQLRNSLKHDY
jgi:hypothetical protein